MTRWTLKNSLIAVFMVASVLTIASCATTSERAEKAAATAAYVNEQLARHAFKIRVDQMYPQRYPSKNIFSDFGLKLEDGHLNSYLPYFGQVQSPSLSTNSQGLNFEADVRDYHEVWNSKKGRTEIEFYAKSDEDNYLYQIYIYSNGKADISVYGTRRDHIRFSGEME